MGVFYTRFSKPRLKFLRQMLYGIQITKSVILNRIAAEIDLAGVILAKYKNIKLSACFPCRACGIIFSA